MKTNAYIRHQLITGIPAETIELRGIKFGIFKLEKCWHVHQVDNGLKIASWEKTKKTAIETARKRMEIVSEDAINQIKKEIEENSAVKDSIEAGNFISWEDYKKPISSSLA